MGQSFADFGLETVFDIIKYDAIPFFLHWILDVETPYVNFLPG